MVRALETRVLSDGKYYMEFTGLHDDTKPTQNLATGSTFMEVDTSDVYFWDEEGEEWNKAGE